MVNSEKFKLDLESLTREHELYENPLTEKQKDILDAAESLFTDAGFTETSTASIAKKAGVTEKTLFKHFPTKQDLLRRILFPLILKTVIPLQIKIVRKVLDTDHKSFREFYERLAADRWQTARTIGPKIKFVLGEIMRNDKLRDQLFALASTHVWPDLVKNVSKYQKSGELRTDVPPEDIARLQIASILALALLRAVVAPKKKYDDERDAKMMADLLFSGIGIGK